MDLTQAIEAHATWQYDIDYAAPLAEETDPEVVRRYMDTAREVVERVAPAIAAAALAPAIRLREEYRASLPEMRNHPIEHRILRGAIVDLNKIIGDQP